ncbi:protein kinase [Candidatus Uabimicrobium sp. HlEnr_7]|uniref:protein kinase domain-containing protein n=1 Tax=Candidatus Uabimicrobium helgolandensis TaxID=3095367 RepID=UPI0035566539
MKICLKVVTGHLKGQTFSFDEYSKISIGRSPKAYFSFPQDPKISRLHCLLEFVPPYNCYIQDLGSSNGTFYGIPDTKTQKILFKRISEEHVENNHYIRVGGTTFRVQIPPLKIVKYCDKCKCVLKDDSFAKGEASTFANKYYCQKCKQQEKQQPLRVIEDFEILRRIGSGAMGAVYLARHIKTQRSLVLKIAHPSMQPNENQIKRFLQEAEFGAQLRHKYIVNYYRAGYSELHGFFYIPMEYVPGIDLQQYITNNSGPLTLAMAKNFMIQLTEAIEFLHNNKIIHRDIKPANILVVKKNKAMNIKLADLGLAKRYEETGLSGITMSNKGLGTPDYLAPEQLENAKEADERSDIYSAAATIYQMVTNHKIFTGGLREIFTKIINEEPIPIREYEPSIPANFEKIVMMCLHKDPNARVQTMKEFRILLQGILAKVK